MTEFMPRLDETVAREMLADGDSSATALFILALRAFPDLLTREDPVEAIELWMELEAKYGIVIPSHVENKINALWTAMLGDGFYEDPTIFQAVCASLYDGDIGDAMDLTTDDLGVEEVLWACYEVALWHGGLDEFSPRVKRVIAEVNRRDALEVDEAAEITRLSDELDNDLRLLGIDPSQIHSLIQIEQKQEVGAGAAVAAQARPA